MITAEHNQLVLTCDTCGAKLKHADLYSLLELASGRGWIGYYPENPRHKMKFNGREPKHFCSLACEKKALEEV